LSETDLARGTFTLTLHHAATTPWFECRKRKVGGATLELYRPLYQAFEFRVGEVHQRCRSLAKWRLEREQLFQSQNPRQTVGHCSLLSYVDRAFCIAHQR
jgi:hypothetical protein